jgi:hypothetical protein
MMWLELPRPSATPRDRKRQLELGSHQVRVGLVKKVDMLIQGQGVVSRIPRA